MDIFDVKYALEHITILVDTREQPTKALEKRLKDMECPTERKTLSVGDYSCRCSLPDGTEVSMASMVSVERKMSIDELCSCFTRGRGRFERELIRAKTEGTRVYLLIENGSWEDCFAGKYRSRLDPAALVASMAAWTARYDMRIVFCKAATTGKLTYKILRYELKEYLEREANAAGGEDKRRADGEQCN